MAHLLQSEPQSHVHDQPLQADMSTHSSLPENDGMHELRQKMQEIRRRADNAADMAMRMHLLMVEDFTKRQKSLVESQGHVHVLAERQPQTLLQARSQLSAEDAAATFCPSLTGLDNSEQGDSHSPVYGCQHYARNVKVQCYDCQGWYTCRHCHDQSSHLQSPHQLNRHRTVNMLCMLCHHVQPAGPVCTSCGQETAYYYCAKCKLWDNDSSKSIYHCDDCGICRRGEGLGKDYVHCKRCNVCISISTSATHPCIERATDGDCPLCLDNMFSSLTPVVSLFCGHYMHAACYKDLMNVTYRCPICSKSAVNMELQWKKLDDEIMMQPMPEDETNAEQSDVDVADDHDLIPESDTRLAAGLGNLAMFSRPSARRRVPKRVWVGCNDCGGRGWTAFHWLGLKCPVCDGYNTNQMTPIGRTQGRPSTDTQHQRQHDFTGADTIRDFGGGVAEAVPEPVIDEIMSEHVGNEQSHETPSTLAARSYFFHTEGDHTTNGATNIPRESSNGYLPLELLSRVSRSLSPVRSYIGTFDAQERAAAARDSISRYAAVVASGPTLITDRLRRDSECAGNRSQMEAWSRPQIARRRTTDNVLLSNHQDALSEGSSSEDAEDGWQDGGGDGDEDDEDDWQLFGHR